MFVFLFFLGAPLWAWTAAHDMCSGVSDHMASRLVERCAVQKELHAVPPGGTAVAVRRFGVEFPVPSPRAPDAQARRVAELLADLPMEALE